MIKSGSKIFKSLSFLIAVVFTVNTVSYAAPQSTSTGTNPESNGSVTSEFVSPLAWQINIPENIGTIERRWIPENGSMPISSDGKNMKDMLVVLIQDAHCHLSAQKNIAAILQDFSLSKSEKPEKISLGLEGSFGDVDINLFRDPENVIGTEFASDYMLQIGKIGGSEHAAINGDQNIEIFGLEDEDLYIKNLKAYVNIAHYRERARTQFNQLQNALDKLKQHYYSQDLKDFETDYYAYRKEDLDFFSYAEILLDLAATNGITLLTEYPNISLYKEAAELEKKIDFSTINQSIDVFIVDLLNTISANDPDHQRLKRFIAQYNAGRIPNYDFYTYAVDLGFKHGISMLSYASIYNYSKYLKQFKRIDKSRLRFERRALENEIRSILIEKAKSAHITEKIFDYSETVNFIQNMLDFRVFNEETDKVREILDRFSINDYIDFINDFGREIGLRIVSELDQATAQYLIPKIYAFYYYSLERDKVFFQYLNEKIDSEDSSKIIFLTIGGFHKSGLVRLLETGGIPYVAVMPSMKKETGSETIYNDRMLQKLTPLDEAFIDVDSAIISSQQVNAAENNSSFLPPKFAFYLGVISHLSGGKLNSTLKKMFAKEFSMLKGLGQRIFKRQSNQTKKVESFLQTQFGINISEEEPSKSEDIQYEMTRTRGFKITKAGQEISLEDFVADISHEFRDQGSVYVKDHKGHWIKISFDHEKREDFLTQQEKEDVLRLASDHPEVTSDDINRLETIFAQDVPISIYDGKDVYTQSEDIVFVSDILRRLKIIDPEMQLAVDPIDGEDPFSGSRKEEVEHRKIGENEAYKVRVLSAFNILTQEEWQEMKDAFLRDYPSYKSKTDEVLKEEIFVKWVVGNYYGSELLLMQDGKFRKLLNRIYFDGSGIDIESNINKKAVEWFDSVNDRISFLNRRISANREALDRLKDRLKDSKDTADVKNAIERQIKIIQILRRQINQAEREMADVSKSAFGEFSEKTKARINHDEYNQLVLETQEIYNQDYKGELLFTVVPARKGDRSDLLERTKDDVKSDFVKSVNTLIKSDITENDFQVELKGLLRDLSIFMQRSDLSEQDLRFVIDVITNNALKQRLKNPETTDMSALQDRVVALQENILSEISFLTASLKKRQKRLLSMASELRDIDLSRSDANGLGVTLPTKVKYKNLETELSLTEQSLSKLGGLSAEVMMFGLRADNQSGKSDVSSVSGLSENELKDIEKYSKKQPAIGKHFIETYFSKEQQRIKAEFDNGKISESEYMDMMMEVSAKLQREVIEKKKELKESIEKMQIETGDVKEEMRRLKYEAALKDIYEEKLKKAAKTQGVEVDALTDRERDPIYEKAKEEAAFLAEELMSKIENLSEDDQINILSHSADLNSINNKELSQSDLNEISVLFQHAHRSLGIRIKYNELKSTFKSRVDDENTYIDLLKQTFALADLALFMSEGRNFLPEQLLTGMFMSLGMGVQSPTGSGKTLIAILAISGQVVQQLGKVDFYVTDETFVVRDTEERRPTFDIMGIKTAKITSEMTKDEVRKAYIENDSVTTTVRAQGSLLLEERTELDPTKMFLSNGGPRILIGDEFDRNADEKLTDLIISPGADILDHNDQMKKINASYVADEIRDYAGYIEQMRKEDANKKGDGSKSSIEPIYRAYKESNTIEFTVAGEKYIKDMMTKFRGNTDSVPTLQDIKYALTAKEFYKYGDNYLINWNTGDVVLLDEYTKRKKDGQRSHGLLGPALDVEAYLIQEEAAEKEGKEGEYARVKIKGESGDSSNLIGVRKTVQKIHNHIVVGMSGTIGDSIMQKEMKKDYNMDVVVMPSAFKSRLFEYPMEFYIKEKEKVRGRVESIVDHIANGTAGSFLVSLADGNDFEKYIEVFDEKNKELTDSLIDQLKSFDIGDETLSLMIDSVRKKGAEGLDEILASQKDAPGELVSFILVDATRILAEQIKATYTGNIQQLNDKIGKSQSLAMLKKAGEPYQITLSTVTQRGDDIEVQKGDVLASRFEDVFTGDFISDEVLLSKMPEQIRHLLEELKLLNEDIENGYIFKFGDILQYRDELVENIGKVFLRLAEKAKLDSEKSKEFEGKVEALGEMLKNADYNEINDISNEILSVLMEGDTFALKDAFTELLSIEYKHNLALLGRSNDYSFDHDEDGNLIDRDKKEKDAGARAKERTMIPSGSRPKANLDRFVKEWDAFFESTEKNSNRASLREFQKYLVSGYFLGLHVDADIISVRDNKQVKGRAGRLNNEGSAIFRVDLQGAFLGDGSQASRDFEKIQNGLKAGGDGALLDELMGIAKNAKEAGFFTDTQKSRLEFIVNKALANVEERNSKGRLKKNFQNEVVADALDYLCDLRRSASGAMLTNDVYSNIAQSISADFNKIRDKGEDVTAFISKIKEDFGIDLKSIISFNVLNANDLEIVIREAAKSDTNKKLKNYIEGKFGKFKLDDVVREVVNTLVDEYLAKPAEKRNITELQNSLMDVFNPMYKGYSRENLPFQISDLSKIAEEDLKETISSGIINNDNAEFRRFLSRDFSNQYILGAYDRMRELYIKEKGNWESQHSSGTRLANFSFKRKSKKFVKEIEKNNVKKIVEVIIENSKDRYSVEADGSEFSFEQQRRMENDQKTIKKLAKDSKPKWESGDVARELKVETEAGKSKVKAQLKRVYEKAGKLPFNIKQAAILSVPALVAGTLSIVFSGATFLTLGITSLSILVPTLFFLATNRMISETGEKSVSSSSFLKGLKDLYKLIGLLEDEIVSVQQIGNREPLGAEITSPEKVKSSMPDSTLEKREEEAKFEDNYKYESANLNLELSSYKEIEESNDDDLVVQTRTKSQVSFEVKGNGQKYVAVYVDPDDQDKDIASLGADIISEMSASGKEHFAGDRFLMVFSSLQNNDPLGEIDISKESYAIIASENKRLSSLDTNGDIKVSVIGNASVFHGKKDTGVSYIVDAGDGITPDVISDLGESSSLPSMDGLDPSLRSLMAQFQGNKEDKNLRYRQNGTFSDESEIDESATVGKYSVVTDSTLEEGVVIGGRSYIKGSKVEKGAKIGSGVVLINSTIGSDVEVADGTRIENGKVVSGKVGVNCRIKDSKIKNADVGDSSSLSNIVSSTLKVPENTRATHVRGNLSIAEGYKLTINNIRVNDVFTSDDLNGDKESSADDAEDSKVYLVSGSFTKDGTAIEKKRLSADGTSFEILAKTDIYNLQQMGRLGGFVAALKKLKDKFRRKPKKNESLDMFRILNSVYLDLPDDLSFSELRNDLGNKWQNRDTEEDEEKEGIKRIVEDQLGLSYDESFDTDDFDDFISQSLSQLEDAADEYAAEGDYDKAIKAAEAIISLREDAYSDLDGDLLRVADLKIRKAAILDENDDIIKDANIFIEQAKRVNAENNKIDAYKNRIARLKDMKELIGENAQKNEILNPAVADANLKEYFEPKEKTYLDSILSLAWATVPFSLMIVSSLYGFINFGMNIFDAGIDIKTYGGLIAESYGFPLVVSIVINAMMTLPSVVKGLFFSKDDTDKKNSKLKMPKALSKMTDMLGVSAEKRQEVATGFLSWGKEKAAKYNRNLNWTSLIEDILSKVSKYDDKAKVVASAFLSEAKANYSKDDISRMRKLIEDLDNWTELNIELRKSQDALKQFQEKEEHEKNVSFQDETKEAAKKEKITEEHNQKKIDLTAEVSNFQKKIEDAENNIVSALDKLNIKKNKELQDYFLGKEQADSKTDNDDASNSESSQNSQDKKEDKDKTGNKESDKDSESKNADEYSEYEKRINEVLADQSMDMKDKHKQLNSITAEILSDANRMTEEQRFNLIRGKRFKVDRIMVTDRTVSGKDSLYNLIGWGKPPEDGVIMQNSLFRYFDSENIEFDCYLDISMLTKIYRYDAKLLRQLLQGLKAAADDMNGNGNIIKIKPSFVNSDFDQDVKAIVDSIFGPGLSDLKTKSKFRQNSFVMSNNTDASIIEERGGRFLLLNPDDFIPNMQGGLVSMLTFDSIINKIALYMTDTGNAGDITSGYDFAESMNLSEPLFVKVDEDLAEEIANQSFAIAA